MSGAVCSSATPLVCEDPATVLRSAPVEVAAPVCSAETEVPMSHVAPPPAPVSTPAPQAPARATFTPVSSQVSFTSAPAAANVCDGSNVEPPVSEAGPTCTEGTEDAEADERAALARETEARRATPTGQLYPDGLSSISSSGVQQGGVGDCYFMAAIAGEADQHPERVRDMIHANDNGTYTVTFPGHDPITVDAPTPAEVDQYAHAPQGMWMPVIEKAYAAVRRRDDLITISGGRENISGDTLGTGISDVTGHSSTTRYTSFNSDTGLRNDMRTALSEGRVVTANIREVLFADERYGLPDGHAYTVTGVDSNGNIMIRNPWGTGGPNGDGRYVFTPQEFGQRFTSVEIEDR